MKLTKSTEAVLKFLKENALDNKLIASNARIAAGVDVSDRTVQTATNWLRDHGYIEKIVRETVDPRTGKKTNLCNEYILIEEKMDSEIAGGLRNFSPFSLKDLKDFKEFKEKDLKQEDFAREEIFIPSESTPQEALVEASVLTDSQKRSVRAMVKDYAIEVVEFVLNTFREQNQKGLIVSAVGWIRAVLKNESERFTRFGFFGFAKKSQPQKSLRQVVSRTIQQLHVARMNLRSKIQRLMDQGKHTEAHALQNELQAVEAEFEQKNALKRGQAVAIVPVSSDDGEEISAEVMEAIFARAREYENSRHAAAV